MSVRRRMGMIGMVVLTVMLACIVTPAEARYRPHIRWRTAGNDSVLVYYPEGHEAAAQRVLDLTPEVWGDVTGYFGFTPSRTPVVIHPHTDMFNGMYAPFPNRIVLYETPDYEIKTFGSATSDVFDLVYTHEFTHLVHITARSGLYRMVTTVFGEGLGVMNAVSPGWVIEGLTTNTETMFTDGGRGRSPLYQSTVLRYAHDRRLWGLSAAGSANPYRPPGGVIYHSGLFMIRYLNETYGPDAAARLCAYQAAHPFGFTRRALKSVTGVSPGEFYRGYSDYVTALADSAAELARADGLPEGRVVWTSALSGCRDHWWLPDGTIGAIIDGYDTSTKVIGIEPATGRVTGASPTGMWLLMTPVNVCPDGRLAGAEFYFHPLGDTDITTSDLTLFDPRTRAHERLTHDAHIFSAAPSPDGTRFAAVRRAGMWMDLVMVDAASGDIRPLVAHPGYQWESPVWSPDGGSIAVAVKTGSGTNIALVDPGNPVPETLTAVDGHGEGDPCFSPDGRWLVYTSDAGGQWNIHARDLVDGRTVRLTSCFTSALRPQVSPDGHTLSFLTVSEGGRELRTMPFKPESGRPVDVTPGGPVPAMIPDAVEAAAPLASKAVPLGAYVPFIHMPWLTVDEEGAGAGVYVAGGDPVGLNSYALTLFRGIDSGRTGYDASLTNTSFWPSLTARGYDLTRYSSALSPGVNHWYRERGGALSFSLPVLARTAPSVVALDIGGGARFARFSSVGWGLPAFDTPRDMAAVFGSLAISRIPDAAPRAMTPSWGSMLAVSHEERFIAGGDIGGYEQAVQAVQFAPSPIDGHGFEFRGAYRACSGPVRSYGVYIVPRGYRTTDAVGGFERTRSLVAAVDYRFPLLFMNSGHGLSMGHMVLVRGSAFCDAGAGWDGRFSAAGWRERARVSAGATLTLQLMIMGMVPVETGIAAGSRLREDEGFVEWLFTVGL